MELKYGIGVVNDSSEMTRVGISIETLEGQDNLLQVCGDEKA
jgi:hypothetical protein